MIPPEKEKLLLVNLREKDQEIGRLKDQLTAMTKEFQGLRDAFSHVRAMMTGAALQAGGTIRIQREFQIVPPGTTFDFRPDANGDYQVTATPPPGAKVIEARPSWWVRLLVRLIAPRVGRKVIVLPPAKPALVAAAPLAVHSPSPIVIPTTEKPDAKIIILNRE